MTSDKCLPQGFLSSAVNGHNEHCNDFHQHDVLCIRTISNFSLAVSIYDTFSRIGVSLMCRRHKYCMLTSYKFSSIDNTSGTQMIIIFCILYYILALLQGQGCENLSGAATECGSMKQKRGHCQSVSGIKTARVAYFKGRSTRSRRHSIEWEMRGSLQ